MIQLQDDGQVDLLPGETIADRAIDYMLHRIQRDVDLRWMFAHTESYRLLCIAYAQRFGHAIDAVKTRFLTPPAHLANETSRIPALQKRIEELEKQLDVAQVVEDYHKWEVEETVRDAFTDVRYALEHCPACAGVPVDSINRCDFCRRILKALS